MLKVLCDEARVKILAKVEINMATKNMEINTTEHGSKASADKDFVTPHVAWPLQMRGSWEEKWIKILLESSL